MSAGTKSLTSLPRPPKAKCRFADILCEKNLLHKEPLSASPACAETEVPLWEARLRRRSLFSDLLEPRLARDSYLSGRCEGEHRNWQIECGMNQSRVGARSACQGRVGATANTCRTKNIQGTPTSTCVTTRSSGVFKQSQ
jgi:hypothetical protein